MAIDACDLGAFSSLSRGMKSCQRITKAEKPAAGADLEPALPDAVNKSAESGPGMRIFDQNFAFKPVT
jgi:hypothetical protein